jgi:hypothetical protein
MLVTHEEYLALLKKWIHISIQQKNDISILQYIAIYHIDAQVETCDVL